MPKLEASTAPKEWRLGAEGKTQAKLLAEKLKIFLPFSLYSSEEPKAAETAKIISFVLKLNWKIINGLHEIDRSTAPLTSQAEHRKLNQGIFEEPNRPVIGKESANQALDRFSRAVQKNTFFD
jgi:broad specificity phosphatase PhoE